MNYVALGTNVHAAGFDYHGSWHVGLNIGRTSYLWDRVRMQGGAYGAMAPYNSHSGILAFCSYRDPNLTDTLEVYRQAANFYRKLDLPQSEINKAIIGVIGNFDSYQLPDAKGHTALMRYLYGTTDDYRQQIRDQVLGTTLDDLHAFGDVLDEVGKNGRVVVVGSSDNIDAANAEAGLGLEKLALM